MDEALSSLCSAYRDMRERSAIPAVKVRILEPETHLLYRDRRMFLEKGAPDQIKPIRILDNQRNKEFFMALLFWQIWKFRVKVLRLMLCYAVLTKYERAILLILIQ